MAIVVAIRSRKLLESDELAVIPCQALSSRGALECGSPNTAAPRIEAAFVTQAIWPIASGQLSSL